MEQRSPIAPTLASRLACACNCAYGISARSGQYTPPDIYSDGAGWLEAPTVISAPEAGQPQGPKINACLVGRTVDGVVVAFRGTLPPRWKLGPLEDWWQDIVDSEPVVEAPLPGKLHEGFRDALDTIWKDVLSAVRARLSQQIEGSLLITGHSKGGPMASIAAARLWLSERITVGGVTTFASPHPGDRDFVHGYPSGFEVTRYENYLDLVPFLPPTDEFFEVLNDLPQSWKDEICYWLKPVCKVLDAAKNWHYESLGVLRYVTRDGHVVGSGDGDANPERRFAEIITALFGFGGLQEMREAAAAGRDAKGSESGLSRIGAAHCIACKCSKPDDLCAGGYMTGSGGDPICSGG